MQSFIETFCEISVRLFFVVCFICIQHRPRAMTYIYFRIAFFSYQHRNINISSSFFLTLYESIIIGPTQFVYYWYYMYVSLYIIILNGAHSGIRYTGYTHVQLCIVENYTQEMSLYIGKSQNDIVRKTVDSSVWCYTILFSKLI